MAEPAKKKANTKVITGKVRGSYVKVFNPEKDDNGKPSYSLTMLLPKKDKATYNKLIAALQQACEDKFGAGADLEDYGHTIHDGDGRKPNGGKYGEECHGHWVCSVRTNRKPGIVDADLNEVMDPSEFESGDYCKLSLTAYGRTGKNGSGVSLGLNNIQVLEKGESLMGGSTAEEDFAGDDGDEW